MSGSLKESSLDALEREAKDYKLMSPEEFFSKDPNYNGYITHILKNIHRYEDYVNNYAKRRAMWEEDQKKLEASRKKTNALETASAGVSAAVDAIPGVNFVTDLALGEEGRNTKREVQAAHPIASAVGGLTGTAATLFGGAAAAGGKLATGVANINRLSKAAKAARYAKQGGAVAAYTGGTRGVQEGFEAKDNLQTWGDAARNTGIAMATEGTLGGIAPNVVTDKIVPVTKGIGQVLTRSGIEGIGNTAAYGAEIAAQKAAGGNKGDFSGTEAAINFGTGALFGGAFGEADRRAHNRLDKRNNFVEVDEVAPKTDVQTAPVEAVKADTKTDENKKPSNTPAERKTNRNEFDIVYGEDGRIKFVKKEPAVEVAKADTPKVEEVKVETKTEEPKVTETAKEQISESGEFPAEAIAALKSEREQIRQAQSERESATPEAASAKDAQTDNTVADYQNSVDEGLVAFAEDIISGAESPAGKNQIIGKVSQKTAKDIKGLTGVDVSGFRHNLQGERVEHINKGHGAQGITDNSMSNLNDFGRMKYILDNYDEVKLSPDQSNRYLNSDGTNSPVVEYRKRVNGNYYIVEAVPDTKAKKLQVITAYKSKSGDRADTRSNAAQGDPQLTSETDVSVTPATNNIQNITIKSQGENTKSENVAPVPSIQGESYSELTKRLEDSAKKETKKANRLGEKNKKKVSIIDKTPETAQNSQEIIPVEQNAAETPNAAQTQNVAATSPEKENRLGKKLKNKVISDEIEEIFEDYANKSLIDEESATNETTEDYYARTAKALPLAEEKARSNPEPLITVQVRNDKRRQKETRKFVDLSTLKPVEVDKIDEYGKVVRDENGNAVKEIKYEVNGAKRNPDNVLPQYNFVIDMPDGSKKKYIAIAAKLPNSIKSNSRQYIEGTIGTDGEISDGTPANDYASDDAPAKMKVKGESSFNDEYTALGTQTVKNGNIIAALEAEGFNYDGKHKLVRDDGQVEIDFVLSGDDVTGVKINGKPATFEEAAKEIKRNEYEVLYDKESQIGGRNNNLTEHAITVLLQKLGTDIRTSSNMPSDNLGNFNVNTGRITINNNKRGVQGRAATIAHEAGHKADINQILSKSFGDDLSSPQAMPLIEAARLKVSDLDDPDGITKYVSGIDERYDRAVHIKEVFADAVQEYAVNLDAVKAASPDFYNYMQETDNDILIAIRDYANLEPKEREARLYELNKSIAEKAYDDSMKQESLIKRFAERAKGVLDEQILRNRYVESVINKSSAPQEVKNEMLRLIVNKDRAGVKADRMFYLTFQKSLKEYKMLNEVYGKPNGKTWFDVSKAVDMVFKANRVINSKKDIMNPNFLDVNSAKELLFNISDEYGFDFVRDVSDFQLAINKERVKNFRRLGVDFPESFESMDGGYYATFTPTEYFDALGGDRSGGVRESGDLFPERSGSVANIAPPLIATMGNDIRIVRQYHTNRAKEEFVDFLRRYRRDLIKEDGTKNSAAIDFWYKDKDGKSQKMTRFVPQEVMHAFNSPRQTEIGRATEFLGNLHYYTMIAANLGWFPTGVLADQWRTMTAPGNELGGNFLTLPANIVRTPAYLLRTTFSPKYKARLRQEMASELMSPIRMTRGKIEQLMKGAPDAADLFFFTQRFITEYENISRMSAFAQIRDANSKIINNADGTKARKYNDGWDENRVVEYIMKYTGTPHSAEVGLDRNYANFLVFARSIISSTIRDLGARLIDPPHIQGGSFSGEAKRMGYRAMQLSSIAIAPLLRAAAENNLFGIFGEETANDLKDIPEYFADNYNAGTFGKMNNGYMFVATIRMNDSDRIPNNVIYSFANNILFNNEDEQTLAESAGILAGDAVQAAIRAVPGTTPVIQTVSEWGDFFSNRIPFNPRTRRYAWTKDEDEYESAAWKWGKMAERSWDNIFGGVYRLNPNFPSDLDMSQESDFHKNLYAALNAEKHKAILGRWIRVVPYRDDKQRITDEFNKQKNSVMREVGKAKYEIKKERNRLKKDAA